MNRFIFVLTALFLSKNALGFVIIRSNFGDMDSDHSFPMALFIKKIENEYYLHAGICTDVTDEIYTEQECNPETINPWLNSAYKDGVLLFTKSSNGNPAEISPAGEAILSDMLLYANRAAEAGNFFEEYKNSSGSSETIPISSIVREKFTSTMTSIIENQKEDDLGLKNEEITVDFNTARTYLLDLDTNKWTYFIFARHLERSTFQVFQRDSQSDQTFEKEIKVQDLRLELSDAYMFIQDGGTICHVPCYGNRLQIEVAKTTGRKFKLYSGLSFLGQRIMRGYLHGRIDGSGDESMIRCQKEVPVWFPYSKLMEVQNKEKLQQALLRLVSVQETSEFSTSKLIRLADSMISSSPLVGDNFTEKNIRRDDDTVCALDENNGVHDFFFDKDDQGQAFLYAYLLQAASAAVGTKRCPADSRIEFFPSQVKSNQVF